MKYIKIVFWIPMKYFIETCGNVSNKLITFVSLIFSSLYKELQIIF